MTKEPKETKETKKKEAKKVAIEKVDAVKEPTLVERIVGQKAGLFDLTCQIEAKENEAKSLAVKRESGTRYLETLITKHQAVLENENKNKKKGK